MCNIEIQNRSDDMVVEKLLDKAFGRDRFKKAAYALRDGIDPIAALSFVVRKNDGIVATLRFWPVKISGHDALLLGPIAVLPELQGQGYGINLMKYGLNKAKVLGHTRVVLVGDEPYYKKVGFSRDLARSLHMPGQDDESRLLASELIPGAFQGISGNITSI
ncbi:GNAT family N-acetyltransferase [Pseudemcibacter aquimaris]|uniref:GNAT family N-acetyltransferase n=1 Tax=Pseudemcibacter aquimaris TaxID=2857064 RepID=UPI002012F8E8|nr:N-acetyltransferase [Pseudemcibacter aquimaris]MCC3859591.1 N-acetyltransferase [Pseudemcibacter aquimaris]WDU59987.1 N-acetyltransferase [Pseudemcibacter aquimaris]